MVLEAGKLKIVRTVPGSSEVRAFLLQYSMAEVITRQNKMNMLTPVSLSLSPLMPTYEPHLHDLILSSKCQLYGDLGVKLPTVYF